MLSETEFVIGLFTVGFALTGVCLVLMSALGHCVLRLIYLKHRLTVHRERLQKKRALIRALSERVLLQSELLSKKAERKS